MSWHSTEVVAHRRTFSECCDLSAVDSSAMLNSRRVIA